MKITRFINDVEVEIELSSYELDKAWREQQREYDIEDIKSVLENSGDNWTDEQHEYLTENIHEVAGLYNKYNNGGDWYDDAYEAVEEILRRRDEMLAEKAKENEASTESLMLGMA